MSNALLGSVLALVLVVSGCDQSATAPPLSNPAPSREAAPPAIVDQPVQGVVLGEAFKVDQIIISDDKITIRQGKDFFPDRAVEISVFPSNFPFASELDGDGWMRDASVTLSERLSGSSLPREVRGHIDKFNLVFGKKSELGVPFSIVLVTSNPEGRIEGRGHATFDDIRVEDGVIDLQWDSLDTLRHVGKQYLRGLNADAPIEIKNDFGVLLRNPGTEKYPKTGFIGFELSPHASEWQLAKLQLLKDATGWRVAHRLQHDEVDDAHPLEQAKVDVPVKIAAIALEEKLRKERLMPSVRGTFVSCLDSPTLASCDTRYDVVDAAGLSCRGQNYRLELVSGEWQVTGTLALDERIDVNTGKVIKQKPSTFGCHGVLSLILGVSK